MRLDAHLAAVRNLVGIVAGSRAWASRQSAVAAGGMTGAPSFPGVRASEWDGQFHRMEKSSMMTASDSAQVVSGVPYLVSEVAGRLPHSLEDFVGTVQFAATRHGQICHIGGVGAESDGGVRFNEKAGATGKDVRIWQITHVGAEGVFQAQAASNF